MKSMAVHRMLTLYSEQVQQTEQLDITLKSPCTAPIHTPIRFLYSGIRAEIVSGGTRPISVFLPKPNVSVRHWDIDIGTTKKVVRLAKWNRECENNSAIPESVAHLIETSE